MVGHSLGRVGGCLGCGVEAGESGCGALFTFRTPLSGLQGSFHSTVKIDTEKHAMPKAVGPLGNHYSPVLSPNLPASSQAFHM